MSDLSIPVADVDRGEPPLSEFPSYWSLLDVLQRSDIARNRFGRANIATSMDIVVDGMIGVEFQESRTIISFIVESPTDVVSIITNSVDTELEQIDQNTYRFYDTNIKFSKLGESRDFACVINLDSVSTISDITELDLVGLFENLLDTFDPTLSRDYPLPVEPIIPAQEILYRLHQDLTHQGEISNDDLEVRQMQLSTRPVVGMNDWRVFFNAEQNDQGFFWIDLSKIVGCTRNNISGSWSNEVQGRPGRLLDIAKQMLLENHREVEHIFHPNEKQERIKVLSINGPAGPIYMVIDGTHRVSGCMILDFDAIPCEVFANKYPISQKTQNTTEMEYWQMLISKGLIKGRIASGTHEQKGSYELIVEEERLPWLRSGITSAININLLYNQLYPGSLDNLGIPQSALYSVEELYRFLYV